MGHFGAQNQYLNFLTFSPKQDWQNSNSSKDSPQEV